MPEKTFFITTPIYYINGPPHFGHFYTTIAADARARFERLRGRRVYFLVGTDENALKVARAGQERGLEPQAWADQLAQSFRDVWDATGISYDDFIRTTEPRHKTVVQRVVEKLWQNEQLYLGTYSGWYSVPDETFFRTEETVERDGEHFIAAPSEDQTKGALDWVEETLHFFKLSAFEAALLEYYDEHREMLRPDTRRNETLAFIRSGLRDTSISRVQDWGIPVPASVPESEGHVVYVWFPDALLNYASAPGYLSDDPDRRAHFEEVWPPDLQLMSKDIFTRFHATLWPSLLRGLDLPLPRELFAHGFWTVDGRKMSKRDPATIVEPVAFSQQIADLAGCDFKTGVDALRYYSLREVTFGSDGDFSRTGCLTRYNSDLANGLGNLVQRALSMLRQYFDSVVPSGDADLGLRAAAMEAHPRVETAYTTLDFSGALTTIWEVVALGNRVIEEQKPWAKMKTGDTQSVAALLRELLALCQWCAVVLSPVMPHVANRLLELLAIETKLSWAQATDTTELLTPGHRCAPPAPLFPRIQNINDIEDKVTMETATTPIDTTSDAPKQSSPAAPISAAATGATTDAPQQSVPAAPVSETTTAKPTIEYADFAKIDLRVAKIIEAEPVPKADKLLKLIVDLGGERRQILAGIAQQFTPESLIGKSVIVVANLAPRKLRGLESQGMLLAASADADGPPLALVTVESDVPPGGIIR